MLIIWLPLSHSRLENVTVVDEISCLTKMLLGVTHVTHLWCVTFTCDCFSLKT